MAIKRVHYGNPFLAGSILAGPCQAQALSHAVKHVDVAVHAPEELAARPGREDGHVGQRVHALVGVGRQGAVDDESPAAVGRVHVVVVVLGLPREVGSGPARAALAHAVVLAAVRVRADAGEERVARVPVCGEVRAVAVREVRVVGPGVVRDLVLREAGLPVRPDGRTLRAIIALRSQIHGVHASHDIKALAVVGGDEHESVLELVRGLEELHRGLDGVVELEKLAQGTIVVQDVHHLVDRGSLRHHEEALITAPRRENLQSLDGHLFESGLVRSVAPLSVRGILVALEILRVYVAVKPLGHVALREDAQSFVSVGRTQERRLVESYTVTLFAERLVVVLSFEGSLVGKELLRSSAEQNVGPGPIRPSVVGVAVQERIDDLAVEIAVPCMSRQRCGRGVRNVSGRNDA